MALKKVAVWYCLFFLLLVIALSRLPGHNGDMTYYIACTIEMEQHDRENSFEKAKQVLDREMSPAEAKIQKDRTGIPAPGIMNFYRIKPFYITCIRFFHWLGFGYLTSTILPSLIAYFFIGMICFLWAGKMFAPVPAALISVLLLLMYPTLILSRLSTPDSLSNACMLLILYLLFVEGSRWLMVALALGSLFIRLDNLPNVLVLLLAMKYLPSPGKRISWVMFGMAGLSALVIAIFMNSWLVTDFWWFRKITYIQSLPDYSHQVLVYFLSISQSALVYLVLLSMIYYWIRGFSPRDRVGQWLLLILAVVIVRFLLFPALEDRFFSAFFIAGFLLLARGIVPAELARAERSAPGFSG